MIILVRNDFTGLGAAPLGKEAKFQISNVKLKMKNGRQCILNFSFEI